MDRLDQPVLKPTLRPGYTLRAMRASDIPSLIAICEAVYPDETPYTIEQLADHCQVFPDGQFVVEHLPTATAVGIQATLIVRWDDYGDESSWDQFTANGTFLNHNPTTGHTLYGAEMMVAPAHQHHGLSHALIDATRELILQRKLWRIRAGSRIPGFHKFATSLTPENYVAEVLSGKIDDPVLSVHLKEGWSVIRVEHDYLPTDTESGGAAALIEWKNPTWSGD